jgi:hypothetical protein
VIYYITKRPKERFEAQASLTLGQFAQRGGVVEVTGPVDGGGTLLYRAAAFLERFSDRTLRPDSIATLTDRTEGWAAGLQLAGLALRSAPDPDAFIAGFAGTYLTMFLWNLTVHGWYTAVSMKL